MFIKNIKLFFDQTKNKNLDINEIFFFEINFTRVNEKFHEALSSVLSVENFVKCENMAN